MKRSCIRCNYPNTHDKPTCFACGAPLVQFNSDPHTRAMPKSRTKRKGKRCAARIANRDPIATAAKRARELAADSASPA